MEDLPVNVKQDLLKLVPAYLFHDTTCFTFYDYHPGCRQNIDVIICTRKGEVIELYQRESILTYTLLTDHTPSQISINRNTKCDIFYLVLARNELFVLTRKKELLQCIVKVCNVASYQIYDFNNVGEPHLRVTIAYDAVPLIFDDEFEISTNKIEDLDMLVRNEKEVNIPIKTDLDVKLAITRYNYAYNVKSLENMKKLRQVAAFTLYQRLHPNLKSSVFNNGLEEIRGALKIKAVTPWIKASNGKLVLVLPIYNENQMPLESIQVLLHCSDNTSVTYTTRLFQNTSEPLYWQEIKTQKLEKDTPTSIAVIIDLKELKNFVLSKIKFHGMIIYKLDGNEKMLPFETVFLSVTDTLGESFDVFSSNEHDKNALLAVIATSQRTELLLRNIQEESTNMQDEFCTHLRMERLVMADNVLVHRTSPYHALNGVVLVFERGCFENNKSKLTVYSRNESQVLTLIHFTNDAVPGRLVITTPSHRITANLDNLRRYDEVTTPHYRRPNLEPVVRALLDQMAELLKYYDSCMMKMNESRNEYVLSKIGTEIDVFACGVPRFIELKKQLHIALVDNLEWLFVMPVEINVVGFESMMVESNED